ncbi:hypothetical protein SLEP1_g58231 [Rubroshorea leprosula]|uniref:Protein kinase domain-containing protein n=1 Tax=Rubroshorea leprosula TaxID=152421 RepID=A0AAV5MNW4_9ROSI|nr:hypothetical protein SLEP1_g58231 [Rubroshorea leprosula]
MEVFANQLTGSIPQWLGNASSLTLLTLGRKHFHGSIPAELGRFGKLGILQLLDSNLSERLVGNQLEAPENEGLGFVTSLTNCNNLQALDLGNNNFRGELPASIANLSTKLENLLMGQNHISGKIPKDIGNLVSLTSISSVIPSSLGNMTQLQELVLNDNNLSGIIPPSLGNCSQLEIVPLDNNYLFGIIPKQLLSLLSMINLSMSRNSFMGELPLDVVKVLNLKQKGAAKSFLVECEALSNIRHRNLIKIITVYSSMDFKGSDFKVIVYEFMQNGSLEEWLHPHEIQVGMGEFSFIQRLNIAIDVGLALEYLLYYCQPTIVHGDLKPSNVLLDHDVVAHMIIRKQPTDAMFNDGFNIHQFTKTALLERVKEILEPSLLQEVHVTDNKGIEHSKARNNIRRTGVLESLSEVARVGVFCSMECLNERMEMKQVVAELSSIKHRFLGARN